MNPKIHFGKLCIAETRIEVAMVLAQLASAAPAQDLYTDYELSQEQMTAALRYADRTN
jgi:uncharacterized protein (DUF433 family)